MSRVIFFFFCMIFFVTAKGQRNYQQAIDSGYHYYKKGDYKEAINKYFAAEAFDPTKKNVVKDSVNRAFDAIDLLRVEAIKNFNSAKISQKKATMEQKKAEKLTLASIAREQLEKNPTIAIRLGELLWQNSPKHKPDIIAQKIVAETFYQTKQGNRLFFENNLEHENEVRSAVFSPDGKKIVTASWYKTAKIWDVETGKLIANLTHEGAVTSAVFSPDGKKIVTASMDSTAKIWDVETGKLIANLTHEGAVKSAVFSPDGKKIVTASTDGTAKIWDAQSGKLIADLTGHDGAFEGIDLMKIEEVS